MNNVPEPAQLLNAGSDMLRALAAKDWPALAAADAKVRSWLQQINAMPRPDARLEVARDELKKVYKKVLPEWRKECEQMKQTLDNHNHQAEARSAYTRTSLLSGEQ